MDDVCSITAAGWPLTWCEEGLTGLVALREHLDVRQRHKQSMTASQAGVSRLGC